MGKASLHPSFHKYLLSIYSIPERGLDPGVPSGNKGVWSPCYEGGKNR